MASLVEQGVRFVQLYSGSGSKWDAHKGIEANHSKLCRATDQPIAGLLRDRKQRPPRRTGDLGRRTQRVPPAALR